MRRRICIGLLFLGLGAAMSCQKSEKYLPERAFYHWKSLVNFKATDSSYLDSLNVKKLYVRYFDIVWSEAQQRPIPTARPTIQQKIANTITCIPVVYLALPAIKNLAHDTLVNALANKIAIKIKAMHPQVSNNMLTEIQIDCDWTYSTRNRYFNLLRHLKKQMPHVLLSATVRLHQVKYSEKQGIPPADRALIMCYNMASPTLTKTKNAIFDEKLCRDYLDKLETYPLPTDIALPLFAWSVAFRQNSYKGLINNLTEEQLLKNKTFKPLGNQWFEVLEDSQIADFDLRINDRIRAEEVAIENLLSFSQFLQTKIHTKPFTVSFYHYAPEIRARYAADSLKKIWQSPIDVK